MGKNVKKKKIDYGSMADEAISVNENEPTDTPTSEYTHTNTQEYTHREVQKHERKKNEHTRTSTRTPTHQYAPAHLPTIGSGERKTERLQLLVRPSTKSRLAEYARKHGTSSNEVVQRLLDDLLD